MSDDPRAQAGGAAALPLDGRTGSGVRDLGRGLVRGERAGAAEEPAGEGAAGGQPILALDPGTDKTGWALYDGSRVRTSGVMKNGELLRELAHGWPMDDEGTILAIEMIASYGMPVGREVFETCVWIGRFQQAWHSPEAVRLVYRRDVKLHLCGTSKAKDPNVRQAILDRFPRSGGGATPQIGTKAKPGPLYGVSTHAWPALGVAITARHQMGGKA